MKLRSLFCAAALGTVPAAAAPGDFDLSFGGTGMVTTPVSGGDDVVNDIAVQSDGKIVVAGMAGTSPAQSLVLARYSPDGSLDMTFNGTGKVILPMGADAALESVAVQNDGKIVAAGYTGTAAVHDIVVLRRNADGSPDTTFNSTGIVTTDISGSGESDDQAAAVLVQKSDGRIVVAGSTRMSGGLYGYVVLRYLTDGSSDTGFNGTGRAMMRFGAGHENASCAVLQSDGKIVVGGFVSGGSGYEFGLARYLSSGALDHDFNLGGKVVTAVTSGSDTITDLAMQTDGKIVVTGATDSGGNNDCILARYLTNGVLDTSFNGTGMVVTPVGASHNGGQDVAVASDGKILVGGNATIDGSYDFALLRYLPNGALDTGFNQTGIVTAAIGSGNDGGNCVALESSGRILVAGYSRTGASNDFAVARFYGGLAYDAVYPASSHVPVTVNGFTAEENSISLTLNYAPVPGEELVVVRNTGTAPITGTFTNLANGQLVTLTHGGVDYRYVAYYYGGDGYNDLVLLWKDRRLLSWGFNSSGQLGDGSVASRYSPGPVNVAAGTSALAGKDIVRIAAGGSHSLALTTDGSVIAWGHNGFGQLGDNSFGVSGQRRLPVTVNAESGISALFGKRVVAIAAGGNFSAALCSDGTIAAWGSNSWGQLGIGTGGGGEVSKIPVAVNTSSGQSALFGKKVSRISLGSEHCLALTTDGTLTSWGNNSYGQLGDASQTHRSRPVSLDTAAGTSALFGKTVKEFTAAATHNLALCTDGKLVSWGNYGNGMLGDNSDNIFRTSPVFVNAADGLSALYGRTLIGISGGENHSLALANNGNILAWGRNDTNGLVGNLLPLGDRFVPVLINAAASGSALNGVTPLSVTAGAQHNLVFCTNGSLVTWGGNSEGQIGNGSNVSTEVPTFVSTAALTYGERFVAAVTGFSSQHNLAIVATPPPVPEIVVEGPAGNSLSDATATVDFGTATTGAEGNSKTITIRNTGYVSLTGLTVTKDGQNVVDFNVGALNSTLAAGQSTTLTITFVPGLPGNKSATLHIGSNDADENSFDIALSGAGQGTLTAAYNSSADVPVTSNGFIATGSEVAVTLNFMPPPGTILTLVNNTGTGPVLGAFSNLPNGSRIQTRSGELNFIFTVTYFAGDGNDVALVLPAPGLLDFSFGKAGKVTTPIGSGEDVINAVTLQRDGKIVVAGYSANGGNRAFALARYNPDGSPDTTFNGSGRVTHALSTMDYLWSVAVQEDGKIVATGYSGTNVSGDLALVRFTANGALDSSFNSTGIVITPVSASESAGRSVIVQKDGKIVVVGAAISGGFYEMVILRYHPNGSLDTVFNGTGIARTNFGAGHDVGTCAVLQSDGKIVAGGYVNTSGSYDFGLARYNTDGTLDLSFNGAGKVITPLRSGSDAIASLAIQEDGKLVAAGSSTNGMRGDFAIARYTPDGAPDTTFNGTGNAILTVGPGDSEATSVAVQRNGKILVGGSVVVGHAYDVALVRLNADGSPDPDFGGTGKVTTGFGEGNDFSFGMALQPDGKPVVAGQSFDGSNYDFALARYYGDTNWSVDANYDPELDFDAAALAVQPDGKVIIGGGFTSVSGTARNYIARLNGNGRVDASFDPGADYIVSAAAIQGDGKIVLGGAFNMVASVPRNYLARLNPDGSVTNGFNGGADYLVATLTGRLDGATLAGGSFLEIAGTERHRLAWLDAAGNALTGFNPDLNGDVFTAARQTDGKLVVGGAFTNIGGVTRNHVARLNANGTLDVSFNPNAGGDVRCAAVQADGGVLIGGVFTSVGGLPRNGLARLTAGGAVDVAFSPVLDGPVNSIALQADGGIIPGGGFTAVDGFRRHRIARLDAAGVLDAGYAPDVDGTVTSLALRADGKLLAGGVFTFVDSVPRDRLVLLSSGISGTQSLTVPSAGRVQWLRGGSSPETHEVSFELSTDAGANWTPLGAGFRMAGGWEITGLTLPPAGQIRARARVAGGQGNGSSGLVESLASFSGFNAEIAVTQPPGTNLLDGGSRDFGRLRPGQQASLTFTVANTGLVALTGLIPSIDGTHAADFTVTASPQAPVNPAGSTTLTVRFSPGGRGTRTAALHIANNDPDESPFDIVLTGTGYDSGDADPVFTPVLTGAVLCSAVQPDGKLIVGGSFGSVNGQTRSRLARFDGLTLDAGFNPDVTGAVLCIAVQADGKILVGGTFTAIGGTARNNVARLNADGTLDTFNPGANNTVNCLAVQSDGGIVLGGNFTNTAGTARNRCARLTNSGSIDTSFNPNVNNTVHSLAVQADGRIVLGGAFTAVSGQTRNGLARLLTTNPPLDATFNPGTTGGEVFALALQPDGKVIAGGAFTTAGGAARNRLVRLTADGTLDAAFNPNANGTVSSLALQTDGKLLCAGAFTQVGGGAHHRLVRLTPGGVPDAGFFGGADDVVSSLMLLKDGQVVIGGAFTAAGGVGQPFLTRLENESSTHSLTVPAYTRVQWLCGGTFPEIMAVTFDLSTNGGSVWTPLGNGTRLAGGWEVTGLNLFGSGLVRARTRTAGGQYTGSSSVVEETAPFGNFVPEIEVEQPADNSITTNGSRDFGRAVTGAANSLAFTVRNTGVVPLTGIGVSIDGPHSGDFTVVTPPALSADIAGGSTTFVIRFVPAAAGPRTAVLHLISNDPDESPFDITLNGTGLTPGTVDMGFTLNADGLVHCALPLPGGGILAGGEFTSLDGQPRNHLARLNAGGTLDLTFNPDVGGNVYCMAALPDGKFLIGGEFATVMGQTRHRLARLNANGSLDAAFDAGISGNAVFGILVLPDGGYLIAGRFTNAGGAARNNIARFRADGGLDPGFNPGIADTAYCLAMQSDGKILAGGAFLTVAGTSRRFLVRLNTDGGLDTGFNPDPNLDVMSLAVQPDGKILAAGNFTQTGTTGRNRIVRLNTDGSPDPGFNPNAGDNVGVVALQADGKILIAGEFTAVGGLSRNRLALLNPDGTVDTGFNPNADGRILCCALQPDGWLVMGGQFLTVGGAAHNRLARITSVGPAAQSLQVTSAHQIDWMRSGSTPDLEQVTFELLSGGVWQSLGSAGRIPGGWRMVSLNLPPSGQIRARGRPGGGQLGYSSGIVEQETSYSAPAAPDILVEQPAGSSLSDGGGVAFASMGTGASTSLTFTVRNPGYAGLSGLGITVDGMNSSDFTVTAAPAPQVAAGSGSTSFTVRFTPSGTGPRTAALHVASNDPDENPFDVTLNGLGLAAGEVDPNFAFGITGDYIRAIATQPDGKILVGGYFTHAGGQPHTSIVRLNANGTLDNSFNPGTNLVVECFAMQVDGRIIMGGQFSSVNGQPRGGMARLNPDGSLDANFNPDANNQVNCMALQPDGKILIGGGFTSLGGTSRNRMARLDPDGTVDPGFNPNFSSAFVIHSIAVQADGKIVVGGIFTVVGGVTRNNIVRLNANGSVDTGFNPNANGLVRSVAVQPDGRILMAGGFTTIGGVSMNYLARLFPNGTRDVSFLPNPNSGVDGVTMQADGKKLFWGSFSTVLGGVSRPRIARWNSNDTRDTEFNPNGIATPWSVVIQPDGNFLIASEYGNTLTRMANSAAPQALNVLNFNHIQWLRSGSSPEASLVTFEVSTDGGNSFALLGAGTRITGGWELTGINLPASGHLRARAVIPGGFGTSSSSLAETTTAFTVVPSPEIAVEQPAGTNITDGGQAAFGSMGVGAAASRTFTIKNPGYASLTGIAVTIDGVNSGDFTLAIPPADAVSAGGSAAFTVQFSPGGFGARSAALHIASNDVDENPFDITLTGSGLTPGNLDVAFDPDITGTGLEGTAVQPDGKILIGGKFGTVSGQTRNGFARLTADGVLEDTGTFNGGSGIVAPGDVYSMVVQADGGIPLGGFFTSVNGQTRNYLARLNADGTLGSNAAFNPGSGADAQIKCIAEQADGKFLLGGYFTSIDGQTRNRIARLRADGSIESTATFNPGTGANQDIFSVAVQPDGKILLGGVFTTVNEEVRSRIARLHPDGTLESTATFNPGTGANNTVYCILVQPDGKILLGGLFTTVNGQTRNGIARLNADGTLESAATFNPGSGPNGYVSTMTLQANGKVLIGGNFTTVNGLPRGGIARLGANGAVESTATFDPGTGADTGVGSVALQADGRILLGGAFTTVNGTTRNKIARLVNDPAVLSLTAANSARVQWLRGGAAPEVERVIFEVSTDNGANWSPLGPGTRIPGGWERTGLNLPAGGRLRARGRTVGGSLAGFSGIVEDAAPYIVTPSPEIAVEQPAGHSVADGGMVAFGGVAAGATASRTLTVKNTGYGPLTGLNVMVDGPDAAQFTVTAQPASSVAGPAGSASFTVHYQHSQPGARTAALHIANNDSDENPYDITLTARDIGTNANLAGLTLSAGTLSPAFSPAVIAYTVNVAYSVTGVSLTPVAADLLSGITIQSAPAVSGQASAVIPLSVGANLIQTVVTAESGTAKTYMVTVNRTAPLPGAVELEFNATANGSGSPAVQPDGKLVLTGQFTAVNGQTRNFIARLNADGTVEEPATFNTGSGPGTPPVAGIVQADGRILIFGDFVSVNGEARMRLARLNADGSVESTATFNAGTGANDRVNCMALQPDGKILIGGRFTSVNGQSRNLLARLHENGSVEAAATFTIGSGASPATAAGEVQTLAVQPDGKILVGGRFTAFNSLARNRLVRLNADGSLDIGFNPNPDGAVNAVTVQPDGKILLGGEFTAVGGQLRNYYARLMANGSVDSAFKADAGGFVNSIALQTNGRILLGGGFTTINAALRYRFARLLADGTLESPVSFGLGSGAQDGDVTGMALQADGRIVLMGAFSLFNGVGRTGIVRLVNDVATQSLVVPSSGLVQWLRSGSGPEVDTVTFEFSGDGGASWAPLGFGTRITGGWELTGLSLPSEGQVRAQGRAAGGGRGASAGVVEQVTVFSNPPLAVTTAATALTMNSATLNGTLTPNGTATAYFEYGLTPAYGSTTAAQSVSGGVAVNVPSALSGLLPNTTYHCRLVASNTVGTVTGADASFTTAPDPPLVATSTPAEVSSTGATLVGAVNPKGRATDVWFEWGSTTLYGKTTPVQSIPSGGSAANILAPVSGLLATGTYHYRIVAVNSGGSAAGADIAFQATGEGAPSSPPSVSTGAVTNLTTTDVTFNGTVNPNGGFTNAYFEYGTTIAYGSTSLALGAGSGSVPGNVSVGVSGLTPGTLYHYRLAAANSLGSASGSDATFITSFLPPVVTTGGASALSTTSARVSGTVRARNAATQVFFDYGTDGVSFPNSVSTVPATVTGDADTAVSANLTLLSQGITYHYRLRAVSAGGTTTGPTATLVLDILSGLTQLFPPAPAPAQGMLTVNIGPVGIGTGWRLAGEQEWRAPGSTAGALTTSDREIEFRPVPGYIQPPRETVSIVSGAPTTVFDTFYHTTPVAGSGRFNLTLKPDAITGLGVPAAERAQWRLSGETQWRDSGTTVGSLFPGSYLVECKSVAGRTAPPPATVVVLDGQVTLATLTYFLAGSQTGTPPEVLEFAVVSTNQNLPYAHAGQVRSDAGLSSGFVVKQRVVGTAGHVVWNDSTLSAVTGLQWLFQRDRGSFEPKPQIPRGFYLFDGYAAARSAPDVVPGEGTPASQNLDVAALYFLESAGRGGFSGFLASDLPGNEFVLSSAPKILVGYPVDGIAPPDRGRMHATPAMNVTFSQGFGRTYTTTAIRAGGGASGSPLCVQYQGGNYYPAAVYLGGGAQTVVRAIDSAVIDLFNRAEVSGSGGSNNTGGGITHTSVAGTLNLTQLGSLRVLIEPAAARAVGAGWRLAPETNYRAPHPADGSLGSLTPGTRTLELKTVTGFQIPATPIITVTGGQLLEITFTYEADQTPLESWRQANFGAAANTGNSADNADPDRDGLENLVEFAFGLNPRVADATLLPAWQRVGDSYRLDFAQPASVAGVSYVAEHSSSLSPGAWISVSNAGTGRQHTFTVPTMNVDRLFLRLKVSSQ